MGNNDFSTPMIVNHIMLNTIRKEKNLTFDDMRTGIKIPEGTIKNVLLGYTKNPGGDTVNKICKFLGVPVESAYIPIDTEVIKAHLENEGIKGEDASILALKEIYERHEAQMKETTEAHIENIRAHYQQHREDVTENYEKRLADKREIIESKNEHIRMLEKECKHSKIFSWVCVSVLVLILVAEVMNPQLGWIKF